MQNESGDFEKMQQQAIKRAKEMQQKSSTATQGEKPKRPPQENERQNLQQQNRQAENFNFQGGRFNGNSNGFGSENKHRSGGQPQHPQEQKKEQRECNDEKNPLASLLNLDGDMSMILPLVLLLSKEGADEIMILALLYIMS